jgi:hypothetical protein
MAVKKSAKEFKASAAKMPDRNLTRAQQLFFGGITRKRS